MHSNPNNNDEGPKLPMEPLLTVDEVTKILRVSESTVRRWCRALMIEHMVAERKYLFEKVYVENFKDRYRRGRRNR